MPLRMRLIALVGLVLLASLACGGVLVGWHAANSVQTELRAALDVGANTIRNGFDDLVRADDRAAGLRHLIATFDGNRHVRATLLDAKDRPVATSVLFVPTQIVPGWFRRLIASDPGAVRVPVPPGRDGSSAVIVLQTDPVNEVGEVWGESRDAVLVLAGFALLSALLICTAVGRALRPLEDLSTAFERIGKGDYHGRMPEHGPPELARLANGFNLMTRRLAVAAAQNRRLNERLLKLQAKERADLARDLHDEIGPLLFAVNMTAATIERVAGTDRVVDIPVHVRSIQEAVGRVQRHVRAILGRLRPLQNMELKTAIDRVVTFWGSRRPDVAFTVMVTIQDDRIDDDMRETIYRVVQEGMSNAIRHGAPTQVRVAVTHDETDFIRVEVADDGVGMPADGKPEREPTQFGLKGMRERIMAMAGSLSIQRGHDGTGLTLVVRLPCMKSPQYRNQDALE